MIPNTQILSGPPNGCQRFGSFGSAATAFAFHSGSATSATFPDDDMYFAFLPGSWFAYRTGAVAAAAAAQCLAYDWKSEGSFGPGRALWNRGFQVGDNTNNPAGMTSREFWYTEDHYAIEVPFCKRIFAPADNLVWTFAGALINSYVWSFEWLQAPRREDLAEALKAY